MLVRPEECRPCELDAQAQGFSEPDGLGTYGVGLVGESLGEHECKDGLAFRPHAPAGSILMRALRRGGLEREGFFLFNAANCRPPRNWLEGAPWEASALAHCKVHRDRIVDQYRPKGLVALGNIPLKTLTNYGVGKKRTISFLRGYPIPSKDYPDVWVLPTFHPSFLLPRRDAKGGAGGMKLLGALIYDLKRAVEFAEKGLPERQPTRFLQDPTREEFLQFQRDYDPTKHVLSYDIETPESSNLDEEEVEKKGTSFNIVRVSLCFDAEKGYAASVPWQEPYISIVKAMLGSSGPKRVWNGNFDNPRLESNGCPIRGRIHDSMWAWHFLQPTLPRALGFVAPFYNWTLGPWKHEGVENPAYYSCCDALALQQVADGIERDLRKMNLWERYEEHVVSTHDVLKIMSKNGLPYSKGRAATFKIELEGKRDERLEKLQALVPMELRSLHPKKGYKKVPKVVEEALHMYEDEDGIATLDTCEGWMLKTTGMKLIEVEDIVAGPCNCVPRAAVAYAYEVPIKADPDCPICKGRGVTKTNLITATVSRWAKVKPFLPTSVQQVLRYCKHMKYKLPRNYKTQNETTGEDALKKIQGVLRNKGKTDDVLIHTIECRQLSKVLGTYVNAWKPGADGRIHSTPGFWGAMFRISWRNPNISGTIADKKKDYIAAGFRRCVEAPEGYVLLERDWSGIEAVLVGYFAGDEEYMRLAKLGVHAFLLSHMLTCPADLSWSDDKLRTYFKKLKSKNRMRYDDAKHCIHGSNYGMGVKLMAEQYEMPLATAKKLQALYFNLFPLVRKWQIATLQKAHKEARLVCPYGYPMWFWDVYKWDTRYTTWRLGDGAKSAISFLPRDTAAGMLKEVLLRLERDHKLASRGIMLSSTHDAVLTQVREDQVEEIDEILKFEMEKPVPELGGLAIGSEAKVGRCWDEEEMEVRA